MQQVSKWILCHSGEDFTDEQLHSPEATGSDPAYAQRGSQKGKYRTTPLKGIWSHAPYFHNGAHETLADVVDHYDSVLTEKDDLVEYLKSI